MEVVKYLKENGLDALINNFHIICTAYPDRICLNYDQIESPRFHPICDECRGLILRKNSWDVLASSFRRFYNLDEGVPPQWMTPSHMYQRIPSMVGADNSFNLFDLSKASYFEKLDGSLIAMYHDGEKWNVATRKRAFAEGSGNWGRSFADIFKEAASKTHLYHFVHNEPIAPYYTYVFELTSPETRVVTPYADIRITLIGARRKTDEMRELSSNELDTVAKIMELGRPKIFTASSYEELFSLVNSFPTLDEGVVGLIERPNGSHFRIKFKNPRYLAVAHMRSNGNISPKSVLELVMKNEQAEYLQYFDSDKKYFSFVEEKLNEAKERISKVYEQYKDLVEQKAFALAIMAATKQSFENGILFSLRKGGKTINDILTEMGADKLSKAMNLKQQFCDKFSMSFDEKE